MDIIDRLEQIHLIVHATPQEHGPTKTTHFLQVTSDNTLMVALPFPFWRPQVHLVESSTSRHWMW